MKFDNLLVRLVNNTGRKLRVTVRAVLKGDTVVLPSDRVGVFGGSLKLDQLTVEVEEVKE